MPARSFDLVLRDTLGNHLLSIVQLTTQLEEQQAALAAAEAEIVALKAQIPPPPAE